jgi:hypothetical protein
VLLEHELLVGEVVLRELRATLRTKVKLPEKAIDEIEALLRDRVVVETPPRHLGLSISDPDDEWAVAEAASGGADVLVTGDAALSKLGERAPVAIVPSRGLSDLLRGGETARQTDSRHPPLLPSRVRRSAGGVQPERARIRGRAPP